MALALAHRDAQQRRTSAELLAELRQQKGSSLSLALGGEVPAWQPAPSQTPNAPSLEEALLLPGSIVELSALPGAGALTLGFTVLLAARRRALAMGRASWLCALDPTGTLSAPAVQGLGVALDELLVVRAPEERLLRIGVRAARSGGLAGLLIDATGIQDLSGFVVGLRRLVLAAEEWGLCAVLLTSVKARRSLPLPCAVRGLVERVEQNLEVRFTRHKYPGLVGHNEGARLRVPHPRALVDEALAS